MFGLFLSWCFDLIIYYYLLSPTLEINARLVCYCGIIKLKMDKREIFSLIHQMCPLQWPDTALAVAQLYAALSWATWLACQPYCNLAFSLLFDSPCWRLICLREGWFRQDWKKSNPVIVWSWWKSLISTPYPPVKTVHLVKLVLVWSRKV